jgi:hypothetical protein
MLYADNFCRYTEKMVHGVHYYTFTGKCLFSDRVHSVDVPGPELFAYRQGALIQDALKSVSVDDREFLMSGLLELYDD